MRYPLPLEGGGGHPRNNFPDIPKRYFPSKFDFRKGKGWFVSNVGLKKKSGGGRGDHAGQ